MAGNKNGALLFQPPTPLYDLFTNKQGAVEVESRAPLAKAQRED